MPNLTQKSKSYLLFFKISSARVASTYTFFFFFKLCCVFFLPSLFSSWSVCWRAVTIKMTSTVSLLAMLLDWLLMLRWDKRYPFHTNIFHHCPVKKKKNNINSSWHLLLLYVRGFHLFFCFLQSRRWSFSVIILNQYRREVLLLEIYTLDSSCYMNYNSWFLTLRQCKGGIQWVNLISIIGSNSNCLLPWYTDHERHSYSSIVQHSSLL